MARQRFAEYAFVPIIYNLSIIAGGLLLGPYVGIAGFSWGALVGAALGPFGLMFWAAKRRGLRFSPRFSLKDPHFRTFFLRSLPVMLGFSLVAADEWLGRYFASNMAHGSISWLQNARRLMLVPVSVLGQAAGTAALPFLTRLHAEGKDREMASVLSDSLRGVAFATLAASAWMAVTATPLVTLFYQRGAFTAQDTAECASALVFFAVGILFWGLQALITRGYYALHRTWSPMLIASATMLVIVPLYAVLGARLEHRGLALATTVGMAVTVGALLIGLRRKIPLPLGALAGSLLRSALVAGLAGLAALGTLELTAHANAVVQLGASSAAFGLVLAALASILRLPEWTAVTGHLLGRLRRRKR